MPVALFLDTAIALFKRYRWLIAVVPLALALAWQSWQAHRWHKAADKARAAIVALQAASDANKAAALAQNRAWEAKSAQIAKDAQHDHELALADARDAVAQYAATHRLRSSQGGVCTAPAASEGVSAAVPESPAAEVFVSVSEADLTTCAANYTYAQSAYEWAKGLVDQGLGR